jgi:hypothetical protein
MVTLVAPVKPVPVMVTVVPPANVPDIGKMLVNVGAGAIETAADTVTDEVPVIDEVTVSVAVIVWDPAVARVTENDPTPLVSVAAAGRVAAVSVLVNFTVPV